MSPITPMPRSLWLHHPLAISALLANLVQARHGTSVSGGELCAAAQVIEARAGGITLRLGAGRKPLLPLSPGQSLRVEVVTVARRAGFCASVLAHRGLELHLCAPTAVETLELREASRWSAAQHGRVRFVREGGSGQELPLENLSRTGLRVLGPRIELPVALNDRLSGMLVMRGGTMRPVAGLVRAVNVTHAGCLAVGTELFVQSLLDESALRALLGAPSLLA